VREAAVSETGNESVGEEEARASSHETRSDSPIASSSSSNPTTENSPAKIKQDQINFSPELDLLVSVHCPETHWGMQVGSKQHDQLHAQTQRIGSHKACIHHKVQLLLFRVCTLQRYEL